MYIRCWNVPCWSLSHYDTLTELLICVNIFTFFSFPGAAPRTSISRVAIDWQRHESPTRVDRPFRRSPFPHQRDMTSKRGLYLIFSLLQQQKSQLIERQREATSNVEVEDWMNSNNFYPSLPGCETNPICNPKSPKLHLNLSSKLISLHSFTPFCVDVTFFLLLFVVSTLTISRFLLFIIHSVHPHPYNSASRREKNRSSKMKNQQQQQHHH